MSIMTTAPAITRDADPAGVDERFAVDIQHVSVDFPDGAGGERRVLNDVTLEIPHGQFVAIVGRSGCGKTTILNLVAGLAQPSEGTVTVLECDPILARKKVGFMLARDALLPWRTAARNVEYGLQLRGVPRAERKPIVERWLNAVHLGHAGGLWPWQLSQGMRQRVALARTWALSPDLLLMDEPFAALDAQTRISVQNEFLDLWQAEQRRTVVLVTHDLGEAIALADRVVIAGEGRLLDDIMIPFERPRDLADLSRDPEFHELLNHLHNYLA